MKFRFPASLLMGLALVVPSAWAAKAKEGDETWHTVGGGIIQGRLSEVYGALAFIASREQTAFVPLADMTDRELEKVADFLAAKNAHPPTWENSPDYVTKNVRNHLGKLQGGRLEDFSPTGPEPKVYLVYFSAGWCGPCHRFTPELVQAYRDWQVKMPGFFEVIFVSSDENEYDQEKYAREMEMPWLALDYHARGETRAVDKWERDGIPNLVAITPSGEAMFQSYQGDEYLGADHVLEKCQQLMAHLSDARGIKAGRYRLAIIQQVRAAGTKSIPPQPYLTPFDPNHYQTLETDEVSVGLEIGANGKVLDVTVQTPISAVLTQQMIEDVGNWLFLPAVEHGVAVARKITVPIQIQRKQVASN